MTQINDPSNLGNDLFGYKINYNQVEGQETPNNDYSSLKVKPRFNGNIAKIAWKTLTEENPLRKVCDFERIKKKRGCPKSLCGL